MYSLGISSGVNSDQLRQIASSDDNVFTATGFDTLADVVLPIVQRSCPSKD